MLKKLERIASITFDIVWSFDNSVFFDFSAFENPVFKILHVVDLNQDFEFSLSARTADLCLSPNRFVVDKLKTHNMKAYFVNHGVSVLENESNEEIPLPGRNRLKACYAGNLEIRYFDWELMSAVLSENPYVDFVFAGPRPNHKRFHNLLNQPNFYHVGVLPSDRLLAFYGQADILLVCYMSDRFMEQLANPHKMMEYLASGKMVCATFTAEYSDLANAGYFLMSDTNASYPVLFKKAIENLDYWNGMELQGRRRAFALTHDYEKQIKLVEEKIKI